MSPVVDRHLPRRIVLDAGLVRTWLGPAALIFLTPPLAIVMWLLCTRFAGSPVALYRAIVAHGVWALVPRPSLTALAIIGGWTGLQLLLLLVLPGERFLGPVTPAGVRPQYRLNGVAAWAITHAVLIGGYATGWLS